MASGSTVLGRLLRRKPVEAFVAETGANVEGGWDLERSIGLF